MCFCFQIIETLFYRFSVVTKGSSDTNSRSASQSDLDSVEPHTRAMSISEPPSPRERYSLMPVITGVEVEVFVGEYESATKFFLSPTNLSDHVRKSMCFLFNF